MRRFATAFGLITVILFSSFNQENKIQGNWKSKEMENSTIKIYPVGNGKMEGKIIESDQKEWVNKVILTDLKYNNEDQTWEGQLYSLAKKVTIDVEISLEPEQKLKITGHKFFMTKTFYWTK